MTTPAQAQIEDWEKEARFLQRELERAALRHRIEIVATIECCAQVAETYSWEGRHHLMLEIADAIRKLKEEIKT